MKHNKMVNFAACSMLEKSTDIPKEGLLQPLSDLISKNEDWLIDRILSYAKARGYTKYTSTLQEAWRLSVSGLSESLLESLNDNPVDLELSPDENFTKNPAASFGILESRLHRKRGIDLGMFLGLMKYYRDGYKDLVRESEFDESYKACCMQVVERYFDRVELGFCTEWAASTEKVIVKELQATNRSMINEKNKYLTVFESLPHPVIIVNKDLQIENFNLPAGELLQSFGLPGFHYYRLKRSEQPDNDKHLYDDPISDYLPWLSDELMSFNKSEDQNYQFEKVVMTIGGLQSFSVLCSRMLDVSGKFHNTILLIEEITRRKQVEEALRESEGRFRQLFNNMNSVVAVFEAVNDGSDYIIKDINQAGERASIMRRKDCIGKSVVDVFPGLHEMGLMDVFKRVWQTGETEYHPISFYQDNNLSSWYEHQVYRLPSGEIVAVFDDVTDRKQAEQALKRTTTDLKENIRELERANRQILNQQKAVIEEERLKVLLQMAGATAHELNQPLMALLGNIELIGFEKADPGKVIDRVAKIEESGKRIADIVKKIQTIRNYEVKPYSGKTTILQLEQPINILSIEDSDDDFNRIEHSLSKYRQINLTRAVDSKRAFEIIKAEDIDLIFLDYLLPSGTGLEFLKEMQQKGLETPVVFITGQGDEMIASQAINSGAYDYLPKANANSKSLKRVIQNALEKYRLKREVKLAMEKMAELSTRDELTGLYNRRYFLEIFERETAGAQRYKNELVLCMMDLDHFKRVNDRYGHPAGDEVLRKVSQLLQESVRKSDIPCRYGGEEFVAVLPNTGIEHAKIFCERFRKAVESLPIRHTDSELHVTISIGLAQYDPAADKSPEDFLKRADKALYTAKNNGRNNVVAI